MDEIWKDIPDYEGIYKISNLGRVKSFKVGTGSKKNKDKEKILNPIKKKTGYLQIGLYKNKEKKYHRVHRLVLLSFDLDQYFEEATVNHKDGNKLNNNLDNLEWCTIKENNQHSWNTGLHVSCKGESHGNSKLKNLDIINIRTYYKNKKFNQKQLSEIFNIKQQTISDIVNNKKWKHI